MSQTTSTSSGMSSNSGPLTARQLSSRFLAAVLDSSVTEEDLLQLAAETRKEFKKWSSDELNHLSSSIAALMPTMELERSCLLCLCAHQMYIKLEDGSESQLVFAQPLAKHVVSLLERIVKLCREYHDAVVEHMDGIEKVTGSDGIVYTRVLDEEENENLGSFAERFEIAEVKVRDKWKEANSMWTIWFPMCWMMCIEILSLFPELRQATYKKANEEGCTSKFFRNTCELSERHEGFHYLKNMLRTLHKEPFVAIEMESGIGVEGTLSGFADNFQLNTALMYLFPDHSGKPGKRVPERVAKVALGSGPQATEDNVHGVWDLNTFAFAEIYQNRNRAGSGVLPQFPAAFSLDNWIWNEGNMEDIPVVDGRRVILLSKPTYSRGWNCFRMFMHMKAELQITKRLGQDEVKAWLDACIDKNRAQVPAVQMNVTDSCAGLLSIATTRGTR